jgi:hypothetical protein
MTTAGPGRTRFRDLSPLHQIVYVVATVLAFVLLIWDIAAGGAPWTSYVLFALILVLIFIRPGGPLRR